MDDFEQLDYYALLGIAREATADEIKRAYRRQMASFHPDRVAGASPEAQAYASRRAQRINEAYAALSDFGTRSAYNRTLVAERSDRVAARPARPATPAATPPRDHLAELYEQAQVHLAAGRQLQAAATLRELLQLSPFYRDSAALLARAEAATASTRPTPPPDPPVSDRGRRTLLLGGIGALLLGGIGAAGWAIRRPLAGPSQATPAAVGAAPTAPPLPTDVPLAATFVPITPTPPPTAAAPPTNTAAPPTAAPPTAAPPTAAPPTAAPPTAAPPTVAPPTAAPSSPTALSLPEEGQLLYAENFRAGSGWPSLSGRGWSVGFGADSYQISAGDGAGNIWAFNTSPAGANYLIGVDVQVVGGLAGLLLRFRDGLYLAFFVNPALGTYRLEQRAGGPERILLEEGSEAIDVGPSAINRLVARLEGESLALRINGQPMAELSIAAPPPSPLYGMVAVARDATVNATFRNLNIRALS